MKIKIEIECDGVAFAKNTVAVELSNILKELSNRLLYDGVDHFKLFDSYGNWVGEMKIENQTRNS